jgi:hypothetical protein
MLDPTEAPRKVLLSVINGTLSHEEEERYHELIAEYGVEDVWNTDGIRRDFIVDSFLAPFCFVTRKNDNKKGTLMFCHSPRFYFCFEEV